MSDSDEESESQESKSYDNPTTSTDCHTDGGHKPQPDNDARSEELPHVLGGDFCGQQETESDDDKALQRESISTEIPVPNYVTSQEDLGACPVRGGLEDDNRVFTESLEASRASTPLSDAPSSLPELAEILASDSISKARFKEGPHSSRALPSGSSENVSHSQLAPFDRLAGQGGRGQSERNFRSRNPIQLHPYMIEMARYNQAQRDHGLKPVRMLQEEETQRPPEDFRESLSSPIRQGSPSSSISVGGSPIHPDNSRYQGLRSSWQEEEDAEEEFPDIDTLFTLPFLKSNPSGNKRRRINSNARPRMSSKLSSAIHEIESPTTIKSTAIRAPSKGSPPSPPPSNTQTPLMQTKSSTLRFRVPSFTSSRKLPTPLTSSASKRSPSHQPLTEDLSDGDGSSEAAARPISAGKGSSSDKEDSDDEPFVKVRSEIRHAERRIRGVLPASWLKLDLKAQADRSRFNHTSRKSTSPEASPRRGVARAKPKAMNGTSRNQLPGHHTSLIEEDSHLDSDADEESELDNQVQTWKMGEPVSICQDHQDQFVQLFEEADEDDPIDAMLPSMKVHRVHQKRKVKRQRRLTDFNLERSPTVKTTRYSGEERGKVPARIGIDKSRQRFHFKEPRLGILDALDSQVHKPAIVPSFLKIAARRARSRRDQGRSNLSGKRFILATTTDTGDVHDTMKAWREGSIVPMRSRKPFSEMLRRPLEPRPLNAPLPPSHRGMLDTSAIVGTAHGHAKAKQSSNVRSLSRLEGIVSRPDQHPLGLKPHHLGPSKPASMLDVGSALLKKHARPRKLSRNIRNTNDTRQAVLQGSVTAQNPSRHRLHLFNKPEAMSDSVQQLHDESPLPSHERSPTKPNVSLTLNRGDEFHPMTLDNSAKGKSSRRRKRFPTRRPLLDHEPGGPLSFADIVPLSDDDSSLNRRAENPVIVGLNSYGVEYSDNFEIKALPAGVRFHDSTYLGGGQLRKHLEFKAANELNTLRSMAVFQFAGRTFRWGPWDENVSSQLGEVFTMIRDFAQDVARLDREQREGVFTQVISAQDAISRYFSKSISFFDPIDRIIFLQRSKSLLDDFFGNVSKAVEFATADANRQSGNDALLRITVFNLILVDKIRRISNHTIVPANIGNEIKSLLSASARWVCACMQGRFDSFGRTLSKLILNGGTDQVLMGSDFIAEAFIIVRYILDRACLDIDCVWDIVSESSTHQKPGQSLDVKQNERYWHRLFTLLPFLEFDDRGALKSGHRFEVETSNWALVKKLVSPALKAYQRETSNAIPGFNEYCRALFRRCLSLINIWGWFRCESIIGTLFDFFARNGLAHLKREENYGSPSFLGMLGSNPRLDAEPQDRCFHLLLKIIGSGLRHMRIIYPHRKIRDFVWRLMPNHGRSHPKEQSVKQEDLDALRNHHDLLCTLYWASPPGFRPAPSAVRNLVDLGNSHCEACHIAIRSWTNLVKFQLSLKEPEADLHVFLEWHNEILRQMLVQHNLARTEAEEQVKSHSNLGIACFPTSVLESTISSNQKQLEAVIEDALVSLQVAIASSTSRAVAAGLISPVLADIWNLFDASKVQTNRAIMSALEVILVFKNKFYQQCKQVNLQSENEDSQDYGDWSMFANEVSATDLAQAESDRTVRHMLQVAPSLKALLSNCFGADQAPNDDFLSKAVDAWTAVASILINEHDRSWGDYVDHYGRESWASMRDTVQTRKYTAYFLASTINTDAAVYHQNRLSILCSWVVSLVERESRLKYQHLLTNALLNASKDDMLFFNLPFSRSEATRLFDITSTELSTRRLSLITCLISNMRASLDALEDGPNHKVSGHRQECKVLLQSLMGAMKRNYEELGPGIEAQGAYVEFAHSVVQALQEHATGICPVDRFFTDSAAFPLPPADPSYVIGQLKHYSLRMAESSMPKQLAVFLQSCSERAAIERQQLLWSDQLLSAMLGHTRERSSLFALNLFLIKTVMPAYATLAFRTSCGWILALPILEAISRMNSELHLDLDGHNQTSVGQVRSVIYAFLRSMYTVLMTQITKPAFRNTVQAFKVSAACYEGLIAVLPLLNYIGLLGHGNSKSFVLLAPLRRIAECLYDVSSTSGEASSASIRLAEQPNDIRLPSDATFNFTIGHLRESLDRNWRIEDNAYFFSKGGSRRRIDADAGSVEEERGKSRDVLDRFRKDVHRFPFLSRALHDLRDPIFEEGNP